MQISGIQSSNNSFGQIKFINNSHWKKTLAPIMDDLVKLTDGFYVDVRPELVGIRKGIANYNNGVAAAVATKVNVVRVSPLKNDNLLYPEISLAVQERRNAENAIIIQDVINAIKKAMSLYKTK